ncbi:hypothetical protein CSB69_2879 [Morganella morganii]|nr:hypothetical protein CSB69_2879 [Morganella morganii]
MSSNCENAINKNAIMLPAIKNIRRFISELNKIARIIF